MSTNYKTSKKNLIPNELPDSFFTADLGLAVALITAGFELAGMDRANPRRVLFVFGPETIQLQDTADSYLADRLQLPARSYFDNLRAIKSRLHDAE